MTKEHVEKKQAPEQEIDRVYLKSTTAYVRDRKDFFEGDAGRHLQFDRMMKTANDVARGRTVSWAEAAPLLIDAAYIRQSMHDIKDEEGAVAEDVRMAENAKEVFLKTYERVGGDVTTTPNPEACLVNVGRILKTMGNVLPLGLKSVLEGIQSDKEQLQTGRFTMTPEQMNVHTQFAVNALFEEMEHIENDVSEGSMTEEEYQKRREAAGEAMEAVFQLMATRDAMERRARMAAKQQEGTDAAETIRAKIQTHPTASPGNRAENPLSEMAFHEVREAFSGNVRTVEDMHRLVAPEIRAAVLREMLRAIDAKINVGKRLDAETAGEEIVGANTLAHVVGQESRGLIYQAIASAVEGKIIPAVRIAKMNPATFLRQYLGYDLEQDLQRKKDIEAYTNMFGVPHVRK
ncbi:MAG: hypothetical protein RL141_1050 [Candidatus Parcubacteria bacterium]|jgi:hypothetical protein